jgi:hypothetical protein
MQVVGFNFTKISGEKSTKVTQKPSTSVEFTNLEKEKVEILVENNIVKIDFTYSTSFGEQEKKKSPEALLQCDGNVLLSVSKEELKDITKAWKKKKLPGDLNLFLFNLILKKCTPKALSLEDELNIPFHVPMPQLKKKQE